MLAAVLAGCNQKTTEGSIDIQFSEKLPDAVAVNKEVNMLKYVIAEPSVEYKMTAVYTTAEGKTGEYMTYGNGGLSFKTKFLGDVKVEITASKEGKKDEVLTHELKITNTMPRVTGKDTKIYYIGDTVTMEELQECMVIVPRNAVKTTFTKVTYNGKETDLTGQSEFTFTEACADTTFYFLCENDGGKTEESYTVKVTPYQNEAEKDDLVNCVDTTMQIGKANISYSEERSPFGKGSYSYKFQADPQGTWDSGAQAWLSYVFIEFPESFDRTKQYITFDAKRSADSYGAIVLHYLVGQIQQGAMALTIPADTWTECSTAGYSPDNKDNTEYTGICFIILHKEGDDSYDPENVWNLIDNMQFKEYPKMNEYEQKDLTNNLMDTLQDGMISFKYSDELSEVYDEPTQKGTYSYQVIADPSSVKGTQYYGRNYLFIDMPFDGSKEHPVFDIKRSADCDANILVYYVIGREAQGSSMTYTEAEKWNTIDTSNFRLTAGNINTQFTGIAIIINHPDKPVSEYDVNNVSVLIDNLRLEENWF